ncbi:hypothetical protein Bp8pS_233 [Bacillus phage vB_BpuM-BpSp]|nr:hypothetical protein Bp8pS_233 [Bacillus phage vB_BpuM-BpSp]
MNKIEEELIRRKNQYEQELKSKYETLNTMLINYSKKGGNVVIRSSIDGDDEFDNELEIYNPTGDQYFDNSIRDYDFETKLYHNSFINYVNSIVSNFQLSEHVIMEMLKYIDENKLFIYQNLSPDFILKLERYIEINWDLILSNHVLDPHFLRENREEFDSDTLIRNKKYSISDLIFIYSDNIYIYGTSRDTNVLSINRIFRLRKLNKDDVELIIGHCKNYSRSKYFWQELIENIPKIIDISFIKKYKSIIDLCKNDILESNVSNEVKTYVKLLMI